MPNVDYKKYIIVSFFKIKGIISMTTVLFSWIGFKDLNYVDSVINHSDFSEHLEKAKTPRPSVSEKSSFSPVCEAVKRLKKNLSQVILFFDIDDMVLGSQFSGFIERKYDIKCSVCYSATDTGKVHKYNDLYGEIFQKWQETVDNLTDIKPYFNLSSGTTAMNAMWIILGKSKYPDAEFIQIDDNGKAGEPFSFDFKLNDYAVNNVFNHLDLSAFDIIKGESEAIRQAKKLAAKAGKTEFNVLIFGESGTGKELFARGIHDSSVRAGKKYMAVNCAAFPAGLLESELFGHKKGTFTGASADKKGLFKECDGGTLFLDEIEACPPEIQAKLLRVLQPTPGAKATIREFKPVGSETNETSDVRIIAATNEKLEKIGFRADLLTRLAVLSITLPALRERGNDIISLANIFLNEIKKQVPGICKNKFLGDSAIKFIESCPWSGNVRQLQNALAQAAVFGDNDEITAGDFGHIAEEFSDLLPEAEKVPGTDIPGDIQAYLRNNELRLKKHFMQLALEKSGKKSGAAKMLGIPYQTWDNWVKALLKEKFIDDSDMLAR